MSFDARLAGGMGVFAAVVDTGSFVRAAEVLDMTPPGVSRAIARLESRLGARLFDRTTRSVKLTDEGRRFHEHITPLLAGMEQAASLVSGAAVAVRGRLRVNADPFFSQLILAPHLGDFVTGYPELELEIITRDQMGDLVADGFDVAVRFGQPQSSTLVARKLLDTKILTVASPAYLKKHGTPKTPADLAKPEHICIQYRDPETGKPFPWEFHKGKSVTRVAMPGRLIINDVRTMHGICRSGHGVAQVMALGVEDYLKDGSMVQILKEWPDERFPLYALYPSRHLPPAKVGAFLDFVTSLSRAA
ncbi:LysR family transcriptional regulator [Undibacterium sp. TJN25]|uniref:LysR family transcriptional regulator n=1 Tax=Undibacterium sp. TJN25 TaxID=3413056 RepID=UPI003BF293E2